MGGSTTETKNENKLQNFSNVTSPWSAAQPFLTGILGRLGDSFSTANVTGTENEAFNRLADSARAGNPFLGQIGNLTNSLFGGGTDRTGMVQGAYDQYNRSLAPTIGGDYLDPTKNPFFSDTTNAITDMVKNRVDAMYAGAGRDPAGAGSYAGVLGDSVAGALAPTFANAYATERGNQLNAINALYGAGTGTAGLLSGLDQTALGNRQAGLSAADAFMGAQNYGPNALLQIEAQRRGIPLQTLAQIAGIGTPIGGLGSQSSGTVATTGQTTAQKENPFNPWSLAPLALMPFTGGSSGLLSGFGTLAGGVGSSLGSGGGLLPSFGLPGNWMR